MISDKYLMVRSWRSDRTLIIATVLLLSVEIVWLLMHLQIIPNPLKTQNTKLEQKRAGFVLKSQQELRKRSLNSLVWENAGQNEVLHYYDSVLTLSQSSATLHLDEQTEVHLSENTLVTIEPQNENADGQIRLKFTRGDLRARNPDSKTRIESNEWSLNLDQGSEVSLRQTGQDDFEVEVLKGHLEFQKDSDKQSLAENQVLKIEDNKISETLLIEENLKFKGASYQRIYTLHTHARVPLEWEGTAEELEILPLGKEKILKKFQASQNSETLELEPGKYTLRLAKNGKVSEAQELEVWQAPLLHLLSPFPRDRVKTGEEISFVWSNLPEAKKYKFILTDSSTGKSLEKKSSENTFQFQFDDEGDILWKVIAVDSDGYEMPAPYSNQLFPRHEPLAAPKLKSPSLRAPTAEPDTSEKKKNKAKPDQSNSKKPAAKKKTSQIPPRFRAFSWMSRFILPSVLAAERKSTDYEAVFAWEPVPGADLYTIEISATPDFRSPQISKTTKRTEFIWTRFHLGTYYWRVAAGTSKGRMGVFSEPAKVHLNRLPEKLGNQDGVLVRKKVEIQDQLEKEREPISTDTDEILSQVPKTQFDEKRFEEPVKLPNDESRTLKESYLIEWTPVFTNWNLHGDNQLKAILNGSTSGSGRFQTEQVISDESSYFVDAFYAQYKWQINDSTNAPDQDPQSLTDARVQILFGNNKSSLRRGGILQTVPYIERKGPQEIEIKSALTVGPSVYYSWIQKNRWQSGHSLSFMAGSQVFAFSNQNSFRYQFYQGPQTSLSVGLRLQLDLVFHQRNFSNGWSSGLTLGFEH